MHCCLGAQHMELHLPDFIIGWACDTGHRCWKIPQLSSFAAVPPHQSVTLRSHLAPIPQTQQLPCPFLHQPIPFGPIYTKNPSLDALWTSILKCLDPPHPFLPLYAYFSMQGLLIFLPCSHQALVSRSAYHFIQADTYLSFDALYSFHHVALLPFPVFQVSCCIVALRPHSIHAGKGRLLHNTLVGGHVNWIYTFKLFSLLCNYLLFCTSITILCINYWSCWLL